jgi:hypothetical protein
MPHAITMLFEKSQRQKVAEVKRLNVYISDKFHQIIFAPTHNNFAGINYEQDECFAYDLPMSESEIGETAINCWNLFSIKDKNLREGKHSDWPAFKKSKAKTIRSFEFDYIRLSLRGANEDNIILIIEGLPNKNSDLSITSAISPYAEKINIGDRILKVFTACLTGKLTN